MKINDAAKCIETILGVNYLTWPQYNFLCDAFPDEEVPDDQITAVAAQLNNATENRLS